jgi:hypothetical protein
MFAAIPFKPVALLKSERSSRIAAFVHAVVFKKPGQRFSI